MSDVIDDKIVQFTFDGGQFEKDIASVISSLDDLNKKVDTLASKSGTKVFEGMSQQMDELVRNFGKLGDAADSIKDKFSALGTFTDQLFRNLSNKVTSFLSKGLNMITSGPKAGFQEYELKMGSIQTIMNGTGETLERVSTALDELNHYADKTIYSFKDMTNNIGKFTNAGVKLDDAVAAIKGIANEAALSGANAQQASHAMYNFSQALSSGTIKLIDWKSIKMAQMDTIEFKNALIDTATALGTLRKQGEAFISTTTDAQGNTSDLFNSAKGFDESLKSNWLTKDVLTKTLKAYATDIREFGDDTQKLREYEKELKDIGLTDDQIHQFEELGKRAADAAKDVKSFTMMMDTLNEAIGSGWARTFETIIGDFEEAKAFWTGLSEDLGGIISKISDFRNDALDVWDKLGGRDTMLQSLANVLNAIMSYIWPIHSALQEVFSDFSTAEGMGDKLNGATNALERFTEKLKLTPEFMVKVRDNLVVVFSAIKKGLDTIIAYKRPILQFLLAITMIKALKSIFTGGLGLGSVLNILKFIIALNISKRLLGVQDTAINLKGIIRAVTTTFEELGATISSVFTKIGNSKVLHGIVTVLKLIGVIVVALVASVVSGISKIVSAIQSIKLDAIKGKISGIGNIVSGVGQKIGGVLGSIVSGVGVVINKITEAYNFVKGKIQNLNIPKPDFSKVIKEFESLKKRSSNVVEFIKNLFIDLKEYLSSKFNLSDLGGKMNFSWLDKIKDAFKNIDLSNFSLSNIKLPSLSKFTGLSKIGDLFKKVGDSDAGNVFESLNKSSNFGFIDKLQSAKEALAGFFQSFAPLQANAAEVGQFNDKVGELQKTAYVLNDDVATTAQNTATAINGITQTATGAVDAISGLGTFLYSIIDKVKEGFDKLGEVFPGIPKLAESLTSIDWTKILGLVELGLFIGQAFLLTKAATSLSSKLGTMATNLTDSIGTVSSSLKVMFGNIGTSFKNVGTAMANFFKSLTNINKAKMFKEIAVGIGLITASLLALALIPLDPVRLLGAAGAIIAIAAGVSIFMESLGKASAVADTKNLTALISAMVVFSGLIAEVSVVLAIATAVTDNLIDKSKTWQEAIGRVVAPIATVAGALLSVIGIMALFRVFNTTIRVGASAMLKAAGSMAALALSMTALSLAAHIALTNIELLGARFSLIGQRIANAFENLRQLFTFSARTGEWDKFIDAINPKIQAVAAALGTFFVVIKTVGIATKNIASTGVKAAEAIVLFSSAMFIMSAALDKFSKIENLGTALAGFAVSLVGLTAAMVVLLAVAKKLSSSTEDFEKTTKGLRNFGITMLSMAGSMILLAAAIKKIGSLDLGTAIKGAAIVAGEMIVMATAMKIMEKANIKGVAVAIVSLVAALYLLIPAMLILGAVWKLALPGMLMIAAMFLSIGKAVGMMSGVQAKSVIPIVATMGLVISYLAQVALQIAEFPDQSRVATGVLALIAMMTAITVLSNYMKEITDKNDTFKSALPKILGFVTVVGSMAAAMVAMAASLKMILETQSTWSQIAVASGALMASMVVFAGAVNIIANATNKMKTVNFEAFKTAVLSLTGAVAVLGTMIAILSALDTDKMTTATNSLLIALGAFTLCTALIAAALPSLKTSVEGAAFMKEFITVIASMAGAVVVMGVVIAALTPVLKDMQQAFSILIALGGTMGVFAASIYVIAKAMKAITTQDVKEFAAAVGMMSVAVGVLGGVIGALAYLEFDMETAKAVLLGIGGTLGIIAGITAGLSALIGFVPQIAAGLTALVLAFKGFATGIVMFSVAAGIMAAGVWIICNGIAALVNALNNLLPTLQSYNEAMAKVDAAKIQEASNAVGSMGGSLAELGLGAGVAALGMGAFNLAAGAFISAIAAIKYLFGQTDAYTWGYDLTSNIATGMADASPMAAAAGYTVARSAADYLECSVPPYGPWHESTSWGVDLVGEIFSNTDGMEGISSKAGEFVADVFKNALKFFFQGIQDDIDQMLIDAWDSATQKLQDLADDFKKANEDFWGFFGMGALHANAAETGILGDMDEKTKQQIDTVTQDVKELGKTVEDVAGGVEETVANTSDSIKDSLEKADVKQKTQELGQTVNDGATEVKDKLAETVDTVNSKLSAGTEQVKQEVSNAVDDVRDTVSHATDGAEQFGLAGVLKVLKGMVSGEITLDQGIATLTEHAGTWLTETFGGVERGIEIIKGVISGTQSEGDVWTSLMAALGFSGGSNLGQNAYNAAAPYISALMNWASAAEAEIMSINTEVAANDNSAMGQKIKDTVGLVGGRKKRKIAEALDFSNYFDSSQWGLPAGAGSGTGGGTNVSSDIPSSDDDSKKKKSSGKKKGSGSKKKDKDNSKALEEEQKRLKNMEKFSEKAAGGVEKFAQSLYGMAGALQNSTSPMMFAGSAFETLLERIYEASDFADKVYSDDETKGSALVQYADAVRQAFIKEYDEVQKNVRKGFDFFNEYEHKVDKTFKGSDLINNAKSMRDATEDMGDAILNLAYKGMSLSEIEELGQDPWTNAEKIEKATRLTAEQTKELGNIIDETEELGNNYMDCYYAARMVSLTMEAFEHEGVSGYKDLTDEQKAYVDLMNQVNEAQAKGIDLQQTVYGNVDTSRWPLTWTDENLTKYGDAIKSWDMDATKLKGTMMAVTAMTDTFEGTEVAFTPMMQTDEGLQLLDKDTVMNYVDILVTAAKDEAGNVDLEKLLALDANGMIVDGKRIQGLIADVGDTAEKTKEAMDMTGSSGTVAKFTQDLQKMADAAGISYDELIEKMQETTDIAGVNQATILDNFAALEQSLNEAKAKLQDFKTVTKNVGSAAKEALEGYGSILDEVKEKSADEETLTGTKMLDNAEKRLKGLEEFQNNILKLEGMHLDEDALIELIQSGADNVAAAVQMTPEQVQSFNKLYEQYEAILKGIEEKAKNKFMEAGTVNGETYNELFAKKVLAEENIKTVTDQFADMFANDMNDSLSTNEVLNNAVDMLAASLTGFTDTGSSANTAAKEAGESVAKTVADGTSDELKSDETKQKVSEGAKAMTDGVRDAVKGELTKENAESDTSEYTDAVAKSLSGESTGTTKKSTTTNNSVAQNVRNSIKTELSEENGKADISEYLKGLTSGFTEKNKDFTRAIEEFIDGIVDPIKEELSEENGTEIGEKYAASIVQAVKDGIKDSIKISTLFATDTTDAVAGEDSDENLNENNGQTIGDLFVQAIIKAIEDNTEAAETAATTLGSTVNESTSDEASADKGYEVGKNYTQGVANGLADPVAMKAVKDNAAAVGSAANTAAKSKKGTDSGSPSKKGYKVGAFYTEGLANGLKDRSAVSSLVQNATEVAASIDEAARSADGLDEHSPSVKGHETGKNYTEGLAEGVKDASATSKLENNVTDVAASIAENTEDVISKEDGTKIGKDYAEGLTDAARKAIEENGGDISTAISEMFSPTLSEDFKFDENTLSHGRNYVALFMKDVETGANKIQEEIKEDVADTANIIGKSLEAGFETTNDKLTKGVTETRTSVMDARTNYKAATTDYDNKKAVSDALKKEKEETDKAYDQAQETYEEKKARLEGENNALLRIYDKASATEKAKIDERIATNKKELESLEHSDLKQISDIEASIKAHEKIKDEKQKTYDTKNAEYQERKNQIWGEVAVNQTLKKSAASPEEAKKYDDKIASLIKDSFDLDSSDLKKVVDLNDQIEAYSDEKEKLNEQKDAISKQKNQINKQLTKEKNARQKYIDTHSSDVDKDYKDTVAKYDESIRELEYQIEGYYGEGGLDQQSEAIEEQIEAIEEKSDALTKERDAITDAKEKVVKAAKEEVDAEEATINALNDKKETLEDAKQERVYAAKAAKDAADAESEAADDELEKAEEAKEKSKEELEAANKLYKLRRKQQVENQKYEVNAESVVKKFGASVGNAYGVIGNTTPIENASFIFTDFVSTLYEVDDISEVLKDDADSVSMTVEERVYEIQKAFNEAFEEIKKGIKDSIDLFTEFDRKLDSTLSSKDLLKNAKSQLEGNDEFYDMIESLAARVPMELEDYIYDLAKGGVQNIDKVRALYQMNDDELKEFSDIQSQIDSKAQDWTSSAMIPALFKAAEKQLAEYEQGVADIPDNIKEAAELLRTNKEYYDSIDDSVKSTNDNSEKANEVLAKRDEILKDLASSEETSKANADEMKKKIAEFDKDISSGDPGALLDTDGTKLIEEYKKVTKTLNSADQEEVAASMDAVMTKVANGDYIPDAKTNLVNQYKEAVEGIDYNPEDNESFDELSESLKALFDAEDSVTDETKDARKETKKADKATNNLTESVTEYGEALGAVETEGVAATNSTEELEEAGNELAKTTEEVNDTIKDQTEKDAKLVAAQKKVNDYCKKNNISFAELNKKLGAKDSLKFIDRFKEIQSTLADSKKAVQEFEKEAESMASTVQDAITNALSNPFSEVETEDEENPLTGDKLIQNLRNKVTQATNMLQNIQTLINKGVSNDVVKQLVSTGAYAVQHATEWTTEQIKETNALFKESETLKERASEWTKDTVLSNLEINGKSYADAVKKWAEDNAIAKAFADQFGDALNEKLTAEDTSTDPVYKWVTNLASGINNEEEHLTGETYKLGGDMVESYGKGIDDKSEEALQKADDLIVNTAARMQQKASEENQNLAAVGYYVVTGMCNGMTSEEALAAITSVTGQTSAEIVSSIKSNLGIASPSKEAMTLGDFFIQGLAIGLQNTKSLIEAADQTSNEVVNAMQAAMYEAYSILTGDSNFAPTITPVVDMSNVTDAQNNLELLRNQYALIGAGVNLGHINTPQTREKALMEEFNSRTYDDTRVVMAVNDIGSKIVTMGQEIESMKIVLDTGTLVGEITPKINTSLSSYLQRKWRL